MIDYEAELEIALLNKRFLQKSIDELAKALDENDTTTIEKFKRRRHYAEQINTDTVAKRELSDRREISALCHKILRKSERERTSVGLQGESYCHPTMGEATRRAVFD